MIVGIVGCLLYVIGDFLYAATRKEQTAGARILATVCNPILLPGVIGNLAALLPWPINQLDHGTESFGHALVLMLGLILLKEMPKAGETAK